jgi:endoglucanase
MIHDTLLYLALATLCNPNSTLTLLSTPSACQTGNYPIGAAPVNISELRPFSSSTRSGQTSHAGARHDQLALLGVNLSGAEYGNASVGRLGWEYVYPTNAEIDHFASKHLNIIRLPFQWERIQPEQNGPLNQVELSHIDGLVTYANSKGLKVILDPHNYGYGYGNLIGSSGTPHSAFADFWGKLAANYATKLNVIFGLMNEPHDQTAWQWLEAANTAISAIRAAGATSQEIFVPGTAWDGAWTWTSSGNGSIVAANIHDPFHKMAFEVHQFLDSDGSGTHAATVSPTIGVERLTDITKWAERTGVKLFLGEFGVADDQASLSALRNMLGYMQQHSDVWLGGTYWTAGPWTGSYMYSSEPANGVDKPQMSVLSAFAPQM